MKEEKQKEKMEEKDFVFVGFMTLLLTILFIWLFDELGLPIVAKVSIITCLVIGALLVKRRLPEKDRSIITWIVIPLIIIGVVTMARNYTDEEGGNEDLENQETTGKMEAGETQKTIPPKASQKKTAVKKQKVTWKEKVKIDGSEIDRKVVRVPKQGYYDITYLDGKIYDTLEKKRKGIYYGIHGANYDPTWLRYFLYSHVPGVKALEILFIIDGKVGSESAKVYQFPDDQETVKIWINEYVRFFRHEAFRKDRYGNLYCFMNNSGYWLFEIKKVKN